MQSISSPTTVAYRSATMAALAAILVTAGFAGGILAGRVPVAIAPPAVEAPATVQSQPGLLEFRRGEWSVGSTQATDQGLLDQRRGEIGVGAASSQVEDQGLLDQRRGESAAGAASTQVEDQGLLDQRRGEIGVGASSAEAALRLQRHGEFTAQ